MSSFNALHLLNTVARNYQQLTQNYSRQEIVKKINEIKYLSAQKKVPKLTLRKEIVHLENKLQSIFELEGKLAAQKRQESAKIAALKKQIATLQKKIAIAEDKDVQKKVEKLSHLLAECIAKREVTKDVLLQKEISLKSRKTSVSRDDRLRALHYKLDALKKMLEIQKRTADPQKIRNLEQRIHLIEQKLQGTVVPPKKEIASSTVKHDIILDSPQPQNILEIELEKELPLPPPPKMAKED